WREGDGADDLLERARAATRTHNGNGNGDGDGDGPSTKVAEDAPHVGWAPGAEEARVADRSPSALGRATRS
ncbi:MAG TPA: hypothetical protein VES97_12310, partial [Solirubrobacteraceae bacterium]|nr:hypothetical protein [Solirubrobacteraceae bacterium]